MVLFFTLLVSSCTTEKTDIDTSADSRPYSFGQRIELEGTSSDGHMDGETRIVWLGEKLHFYATDKQSTLRVYDNEGLLRYARSFSEISERHGIETVFSVVLNSDSTITALAQSVDGYVIFESLIGRDSVTVSSISLDSLLPYALPTLLDLAKLDDDRYICPIQYFNPGFSPTNDIWERKFSCPTIAVLKRTRAGFEIERFLGGFHNSFRLGKSYYDVDGSGYFVSPSSYYCSFLFENRISVIDCQTGDTARKIELGEIDESTLSQFNFARIQDMLFIREYYYTQPRYRYLWADSDGDTVIRMFIPPGPKSLRYEKYSRKNWQLIVKSKDSDQVRYSFNGNRFFSDVFLVENSKSIWLREADSSKRNVVLRRVSLD